MKQVRYHADAIAAETGLSSIHRLVNDIADNFDAINARIGQNQTTLVDDPNNPGAQFAGLPAAAQFTVTGVDGKYLVAITNPQDINAVSVTVLRNRINFDTNQNFTPLIHQLQSATDTNFNQASGVNTYGPSSQLSWEIQDPNQTKFWRLRSSYDGQNWNDWQIYSSAATCGPVGVQSGFLRSTSAAPRGVTNNSNNATVDSVDNGDGTDTIRIYGPGGVGSSFTEFDGQGNQITLPAGTVGGAAQSTFYQIVYSAATGYRAFPNATQYTSSLLDQYYIVSGNFQTVAAGGGGGSTGGGGTSGGGGGTGGGGNRLPKL